LPDALPPDVPSPAPDDAGAALALASAEPRRLHAEFARLLALVQKDMAGATRSLERSNALLAEQAATIRSLRLQLVQERARRQPPKTGRVGNQRR
jgi:hypothetical protein